MGDDKELYSVPGVKFHERGNAPAIVLENKETGLSFGILVNKHAARMMRAVLDNAEKKRYTRPLTHDFVLGLARVAGVGFASLVIDRLNTDGSFGATLEICDPDGHIIGRVDARPSDALPVAVAGNVPVFVKADIARKAAAFYPEPSPFREIRPEDLDLKAS